MSCYCSLLGSRWGGVVNACLGAYWCTEELMSVISEVKFELLLYDL